MKHTFKFFGTVLVAVTVFTSCADLDPLKYAYEKPASIEGMEYLADYGPLKEYKSGNSKISPNFKLGVALAATDYNANGLVTRLANANFDEVVAGNEMKMASIVNDKGNMDFGTVDAFVRNATDNGISVYGHTLAWHAQQPVKWLNSLLADKPVEVDPDAMVEIEDYSHVYATDGYPFWSEINSEVAATTTIGVNRSGNLEIYNPVAASQNHFVQYHTADNLPIAEGKPYILRMKVRGSSNGALSIGVGPWSGRANGSIPFTTEWAEHDFSFTAVADGGHVMTQSGTFVGTIEIAWVKILHTGSAGPVTYMESLIDNGDMEGSDDHNFFVKENSGSTINRIDNGVGVDGSRGAKIVSKGGQADAWESQFWIASNKDINAGDKIHLKFDYRADGGCAGTSVQIQTHMGPGDYINWQSGFSDVAFTSGWQTYDKTITISEGACRGGILQSLAFNMSPNSTDGIYYVDNVVFEVEKAGDGIPLTPEEKKDTLTWAMDKWISGMMEACEGKVKGWDVVNEAISGGNPDQEGVYALQHATPDNKTDFFWQDYMGDLDYVRTAVRLARQYGPEDIQLFVNDYNLESDWDQNGKLKSLIKWIERWESDGETIIDGIGTQMHISYYANPQTLESKKAAVENMFKLMAATGKLVRVSELDMGYVDAQGNSLKTEQLTDAQHREMANYYKWIIQTYIQLVPANQQYGITQWCITDAPADSGWRKGEPVGLWDLNYNRKHAYGGFADGLQGK